MQIFMKMSAMEHFSQKVNVFRQFPPLKEDFTLAGYGALIESHSLSVPAPDQLCVIGSKHRRYDHDGWRVFTPRHEPEDSLGGHLTFALKHEGVDLTVLKALFDQIDPWEIVGIVESQPTGAYSRRIWFLFEWLTDQRLDLEDARQLGYVPLVNEELQYGATPRNSRRHRIQNNLPGTRAFCPMIRRTETLDRLISKRLSQTAEELIGKTHVDLISRAAAFLLVEDTKATYAIEGEYPARNRIERWGKIVGQAGQRELSISELEHLQTIVISNMRFITPGCRVEGGFIGNHDRSTGMPLPVHISAKPEDLQSLLGGLLDTYKLLADSDFDIVLSAAIIAFGFVFIHPFEDGNGRIHRYLLHHVLGEQGFVPENLVFPISAAILYSIRDYARVLEHYSKPRLDLIDWRRTPQGNVEVLNNTVDLYRYFDCTKQAEFLFKCVEETVTKILPEEIDYLQRHDRLNEYLKNDVEMPDRLADLLIRFLRQNDGKLSNRARKKEFSALTDEEVREIEHMYDKFFLRDEHGS